MISFHAFKTELLIDLTINTNVNSYRFSVKCARSRKCSAKSKLNFSKN